MRLSAGRETVSRRLRVETIGDASGIEEYMHLDGAGAVQHCVSGDGGGASRRKSFELAAIWGRNELAGKGAREPAPPLGLVSSIELICCTFNRLDLPIATVEQLLQETRSADPSAGVRIVFQNEDFPQRLFEKRPQWRERAALKLTPSFPPGLPRARNAGLAASSADLVVFVDDDVEIDPGFLAAHVRAANDTPEAIGVAGRIRSRVMGADRVNRSLAVGQIRLSGRVEDNFDSVGAPGVTVVVHTPRGANMAFRRQALLDEMGPKPFDESLPGSAHREETTLAMELFRRGHYIVFAPDASLLHLEAESGGCENRGPLTVQKRLDHLALEYLFLNRLYAPTPLLRTFAPLLQGVREVRGAKGIARKVFRAGVNVAAYWKGRHLYAERRP